MPGPSLDYTGLRTRRSIVFEYLSIPKYYPGMNALQVGVGPLCLRFPGVLGISGHHGASMITTPIS